MACFGKIRGCWKLVVVMAGLLGGSAGPASAEETEPEAVPAQPPIDSDAGQYSVGRHVPTTPRSDVLALQTATGRVRDFLAGSLDVGMNPSTLFDIGVADDRAVRVEAERLRGVIARTELPPVGAARPAPTTGGPSDAGASAAFEEPATDAGPLPAAALPDPELFAARVELDRARLAFYSLPSDRRAALLEQHRERVESERQGGASTELSEAEQRSREAEAERQRAVEAALHARSEAVRLLEEERARLHSLSGALADFEARLVRRRLALEQRAERTLAYRRQVREVLQGEPLDRRAADGLYDDLRAFLRASRQELDQAISEMFAQGAPPSDGDRLAEIPGVIDRTEVEALAATISATRRRLLAVEKVYRADHASQLYEEVTALNLARLSLLRALTSSKRKAITGFSYGGLDQAGAELRQVSLVLRYRLAAARSWAEGLGKADAPRSGAAFTTGFTALKWFLLVGAFWWWRRRSDPLLTQWRERIQQDERQRRATEPGPLYRLLRFLQRTRHPLEWLVFLWLLVWLLPAGANSHPEIALVTTIFTWVLGGSFMVTAIDSLSKGKAFAYGRTVQTTIDQVRLRSLRLAGRTVVVLGLVLALSAQLVGQGAIYSWSLSLCWLAAIPVILIILRWWRDIIFQRVGAQRKKKAFHRWVGAHQTGWRSFPAAVSGGIYLFVLGARRAGRNWFTSFDLTRRGLAYLFRRDMDRLAEEKKIPAVLQPLPEAMFATLGPETFSDQEVEGSATEELDGVIERVSRQGGGVFAVVGERGRGKTTVLRRVEARGPGVLLADCPSTGLEGLRQDLAGKLGLPPTAAIEDSAAHMDQAGRDAGVLIDHAHRLIHPVIGGLADFDRLLGAARRNSTNCAWFFAFNEVIWCFLERARGSRPLFDDVVKLGPWQEEEIGELLTLRCKQAKVQPHFEHVMDALPADADDIDRAEALTRVTAGYYRMIWDYSAGNAGVALHAWRRSLGIDEQGRVCVKLFRVPDAREFEKLPEHAAFVFRAVIQQEPALATDVMRATMLRGSQVEDLLRYGTTHGYFEQRAGRYRITWDWFRPITRFLQRRHLLADF